MDASAGSGRAAVHAELVAAIEAAAAGSPGHLRVGVDGRDGAGKTTLADALMPGLAARGLDVVRSGIDGWHQPARIRYARGHDSPEGYYRDSFDLDALRRDLLDPFGRLGEVRCRLTAFDHRGDEAVEGTWTVIGARVVLLFDGVFLLRPELRACWDFSIYLQVDPEVALERAIQRDATALGGPEAARNRYLARYLPGQALYHAEAAPERAASIVVDMTYTCPSIVRRRRPA